MARAKARKRSSGKRKKAVQGRPRNPFTLVLRKRAGGAEPSSRAYQRRGKHKKKIEAEE